MCTHTHFSKKLKNITKSFLSLFFSKFPFWQQRRGRGHSAVHLSGRSKSEARHYLLTGLSHNHKTTVLASLIPILHPWREQRCPACAEVVAETKEKESECQKLLGANDEQTSPPRLVHPMLLNWAILLAMKALTDLFDYCFLWDLETYPHPLHWLVVVLFPWLGYSFKICSLFPKKMSLGNEVTRVFPIRKKT